jgi:hypothetical protein
MYRASSQHIRRSLLGYRRGAVQQLLAEGEEMERAAEGAILNAEARVNELESELDEVRRGLEGRDAELRRMQAELEQLELGATTDSPQLLSREVDAILTVARETAAHVVERARALSRREAEETGGDVRLGVARLIAWREEAIPAMREVESNLRQLRQDVEALVQRLERSIEPLTRIPVEGVSEALESVGSATDAGLEIHEPLPDGDELRIVEPAATGPATEAPPRGRWPNDAPARTTSRAGGTSRSNGGRARVNSGERGEGTSDAVDLAAEALSAGSTS